MWHPIASEQIHGKEPLVSFATRNIPKLDFLAAAFSTRLPF